METRRIKAVINGREITSEHGVTILQAPGQRHGFRRCATIRPCRPAAPAASAS